MAKREDIGDWIMFLNEGHGVCEPGDGHLTRIARYVNGKPGELDAFNKMHKHWVDTPGSWAQILIGRPSKVLTRNGKVKRGLSNASPELECLRFDYRNGHTF